MGGTRDATNVFTPAGLKLAMVTAIGLEHQKALGDTLTDIAAAKAGILKQGRPAVIARQPEAEALRELERAASEKGCPVVHPERIVSLQAHVTLSPFCAQPNLFSLQQGCRHFIVQMCGEG